MEEALGSAVAPLPEFEGHRRDRLGASCEVLVSFLARQLTELIEEDSSLSRDEWTAYFQCRLAVLMHELDTAKKLARVLERGRSIR